MVSVPRLWGYGKGPGGLTGSQNFDKPLPSTPHPHPFLGRPGCVPFLSLLAAPGAAQPARVTSSTVALRSHQYLFLRQLPLSVCFSSSKLRRRLDVPSAPSGPSVRPCSARPLLIQWELVSGLLSGPFFSVFFALFRPDLFLP